MKAGIARAFSLAAMSLSLAASPARSDDATQPDRQKVAAQVRQTLKSDGHMSDQDIAAMSHDIDRHSGDHGYGEAVSATVHQAQASGCLGTCLAEAVHQVNHAMDRGKSADQASKMVGRAVADAKGSETQRRDRVRKDVDAALHDHQRDRMHDRSQGMAGGAGHGGGMGGMHGGQH
ncbi:MAG TPA: hypothetical protein VFR85_01815 [Anaeromyxobacteraceae bacterium]|nr:hypothetical protein [Anaeromyxobacteraceae bacterium]